jgi:hypothetical protein
MREQPQTLDADELRDLRRLVGIMVPPSTEFGMPGADDEMIFTDIARSIGRDLGGVRAALAMLREAADSDFSRLDALRAEGTAMAMLSRGGPAVTALGRVVLQCYYRDDRVMRALGREPRAPFPKGHAIEAGDLGLLEAVRRRPRMWRDVDGRGPDGRRA